MIVLVHVQFDNDFHWVLCCSAVILSSKYLLDCVSKYSISWTGLIIVMNVQLWMSDLSRSFQPEECVFLLGIVLCSGLMRVLLLVFGLVSPCVCVWTGESPCACGRAMVHFTMILVGSSHEGKARLKLMTNLSCWAQAATQVRDDPELPSSGLARARKSRLSSPAKG